MAVGELHPPSPDDPLVGTVISERYRVLKKLGEGGMGAVYLAEHVFIEKKVALKVLAPELSRKADLTARFLQEAKSASRIGHENVIDISDFGQSPEGLVYFAMEFLSGCDLGQALRKDGAMPWARARGIVLQICKALRAAHNKGIIHRDMKPENVFLIDKEGRPDFVKLLDFGIAKVQTMGEDEGPRLTKTGMIFGTPEYMAPEQAEGKVCDHRADIYAVGCVMYHIITGAPPFAADNFMAMLTKHLLEDPVAPSARRPDLAISPEIDALVMKALLKDREQRWQDLDTVIDAIAAIPGDEAQPTGQAMLSVPPGTGAIKHAETRQMGGQDAVATARRAIEARTGERTEHLPSRRSSSASTLIVGGLVLGALVAVAIVLSRGKADEDTATSPAPAAAPVTAAPEAPAAQQATAPAAAAPETAEAAAAPASGKPDTTAQEPAPASGSERRRRRGSPGYRRIELEAEAAADPGKSEPKPTPTTKAPAELKIPAELKAFPGQ